MHNINKIAAQMKLYARRNPRTNTVDSIGSYQVDAYDLRLTCYVGPTGKWYLSVGRQGQKIPASDVGRFKAAFGVPAGVKMVKDKKQAGEVFYLVKWEWVEAEQPALMGPVV